MAKHNIVTYNSASKGFETDLQDNTAQIVGSGNNVFSVQSGSTELFSVGTDNTSVTINTNLTSSGDISGSGTSTGSFGRLIFTSISGDASQMTNVDERGHVSGAAQIASRISGAFDAGFKILGNLSGSATSTGSFARVFANHYVGDASQMTNVFISPGTVSASAQLAADISGAFDKGFEFEGLISGSAQSTASFGRIFTNNYSGDASQMTNVPITTGTVSGSAQIASDVSGAFQRGFVLEGTISGSMTSTASFHTVDATSYVITNEPDINTPLQQLTTVVSSSAQLATAISGAFDKGFEFTGSISGSVTSTGSFSRLDATTLVGDASQITNLNFNGAVSGSLQLAADISGAFNVGFKYTGIISGSATSTGSFGKMEANKYVGDFSAISANEAGHFSGSSQLSDRICGSFANQITFGGNQITSSYFVGVSGSTFHFVSDGTTVTGGETTMSISSLCGSDYDYRIFDSGDRSTSYNRIGPAISPKHTNQAWNTVAPLVGGGKQTIMVVGTSDSALAAGGYHTPTPSPSAINTSEKYNGATWSVSALQNSARANAGSAGGSQNAALIFGGRVTSTAATATTERYNGSTWSEVADLPAATPAGGVGGFGTQNDAYAQHEVSEAAEGQNFNGTTWSESAAHNTQRTNFGIDGTHNSAIMIGAYNSPIWQCTEIYDGVTWSEATALPNGSRGPTVSGTANSAHVQGNHFQVNGGTTYQHWDGTAFTLSSRMTTRRAFAQKSGAGISSNNLFIGGTGNDAPYSTKLPDTEHFQINFTNTGSFHAISAVGGYQSQYSRSIDTSGVTFDFGGNFPTAQTLSTLASDISGSFNNGFTLNGTISSSATSTGSLSNFKADTVVTDNMSIGSFTDTNLMPYQSSSFKSHTNKPFIIPYVGDAYYDSRRYVPTGSGYEYSCGSCTEFSNGYNSADGQLSIGRDGILNISFQSSSFSTAGAGQDAGKVAGTWSAGPDMVTATRGQFFGQQNASVMVSGATNEAETGGFTTHTQHYNGISWRRGADILEGKSAVGGGQGYGHGEDDIGVGRSYTNGPRNLHLQYNGHSWYYMTTNLTTDRNQGGAGTQNAAVIYGGSGSPNTKTEEWNGHTWDVGGDMVSGKSARVGAGSQNAAIAGAGTIAPATWVYTELYNGTTWSAGPNTPYVGTATGAGMGGTQNNALGRGASPSSPFPQNHAATWDGVAWAQTVNTPDERHQGDVSGNSALGMVAGGGSNPGASVTTTLEWNNSFNTGSFLVTKKIGSNFS